MALSGSLNTSTWYGTDQNGALQFSWTATQSIDGNTSTISWTLKGVVNESWIMAGGFKVVIDGDTVYSKDTNYRIKLYNGTVVASGTKTLSHNADGTRSFSVSAQGGIYTFAVNVTGSKTFTLDTIPRTSSVTATNANIGSNPTITINRASSSFTHTLTYSFSGLTGTIATKTTATKISTWTVPTSFYAKIPNDPSGKCTITCTTYNGNTAIGSSTCEFTATADRANCSPSVSISCVDVNAESKALTGNNKSIVLGISNLRVVTTATARNSATITSITAYCGSAFSPGADVTFNGASSKNVYVIVTDSRGYSTRVDDTSLSFVNYITPTINPTITRDTPTGNAITVTIKGKWFNGSFGAVSNTLRLRVAYKVDGADGYGAYTDVPVTKNGNDYTATVSLSGLAYTNAYKFQIRLDDEVYTDSKGYRQARYYYDYPLSKGVPVFDWGENDFKFNVPVSIDGTLTIGGTTITEAQLTKLLALIK